MCAVIDRAVAGENDEVLISFDDGGGSPKCQAFADLLLAFPASGGDIPEGSCMARRARDSKAIAN
jgi:hypothetical protein